MEPPEMRGAGLEQADPKSQQQTNIEHDQFTVSPNVLQESKLIRLYAFAHETARAIAALVYGVAR